MGKKTLKVQSVVGNAIAGHNDAHIALVNLEDGMPPVGFAAVNRCFVEDIPGVRKAWREFLEQACRSIAEQYGIEVGSVVVAMPGEDN
jgi:hypothetical protein